MNGVRERRKPERHDKTEVASDFRALKKRLCVPWRVVSNLFDVAENLAAVWGSSAPSHLNQGAMPSRHAVVLCRALLMGPDWALNQRKVWVNALEEGDRETAVLHLLGLLGGGA